MENAEHEFVAMLRRMAARAKNPHGLINIQAGIATKLSGGEWNSATFVMASAITAWLQATDLEALDDRAILERFTAEVASLEDPSNGEDNTAR
jgi:hypothetical protein